MLKCPIPRVRSALEVLRTCGDVPVKLVLADAWTVVSLDLPTVTMCLLTPGGFSPLGLNTGERKPTHGRAFPGGTAGLEAPLKLIRCLEPQVPP